MIGIVTLCIRYIFLVWPFPNFSRDIHSSYLCWYHGSTYFIWYKFAPRLQLMGSVVTIWSKLGHWIPSLRFWILEGEFWHSCNRRFQMSINQGASQWSILGHEMEPTGLYKEKEQWNRWLKGTLARDKENPDTLLFPGSSGSSWAQQQRWCFHGLDFPWILWAIPLFSQ